jgi:hypothetical protein
MRKRRPIGKLAEPIEITLTTFTLADALLPPEAAKMNAVELRRGIIEATAKVNAAERQRGFTEAMDRLELLFPHYGLNRTGDDALDFRLLALAMATRQFPGFQVKNINEGKRYQHKRGNAFTLLLLLADVETIKREWKRGTCSDTQAIMRLIADSRFASEWGSRKVETLQNWLADARDPEKNRLLPSWRAASDKRLLIVWINLLVRGRQHP